MMNKITLTINDQQVEGSEGMTVLEVANEAGIYVPTLCYHSYLAPFGGCRLCV
ncbi:MAG: 2Fe-2S iron-sulfur cluster-binding protein, partial [Chloroflexota bacterium]